MIKKVLIFIIFISLGIAAIVVQPPKYEEPHIFIMTDYNLFFSSTSNIVSSENMLMDNLYD